MKFLLVSGGTISTLGKGIAASSVSLLLQQSGLRVTNIKIDPYLNVDAALFRPLEHGETYVLASGGEVDLDLGNYERFCDIELTKAHSITAGKLYKGVLDRERAGAYLGKTVQVIPHLTDYCQELIEEASRVPVDKSGCQPDVCVIELGGVITDLESAVFVESLRTLKYRVGSDNFAHIHINLVPIVGSDSEQKSKPTQTAVKSLMQQGLGPDLIFCRCAHKLQPDVAKKIAFFAMIPQTGVVSMHDLPNIMHVPQILLDQNVPALIHNVLRFNKPALVKMPELWRNLTQRLDLLDSSPQSQQNAIKIALVGKYVELQDAYLSIKKSLLYVSIHINKKIDILWIDASHLDATTKEQQPDVFAKAWEELKSAQGVIIPGGFGTTGIAGKLLAIHYCRIKKVPMLGICLGFQLAVIEFCQNVLKVEGATSEEFDPASKTTVIAHMDDLDDSKIMGGTMRLGNTTVLVAQNSLLHYLYGSRVLVERHRHRYEVNPQYVDRIQANGGRFTGCDPTRTRMECFELDYEQHQHPFYFCVQYHPEFTSRVMAPNPCFVGLALAAAKMFSLPVGENQQEQQQQQQQQRSSVLPQLQLRPISQQQAAEGGQPQFEWDPKSNIKNTMDIDLSYYEKDDATQLHAATPSNGGKKTKPALILPTHFFIPE